MRENRKVFISHAHADNERCAPLVNALRDWGVDYWFDVASMEAGADLSTRIQQAISACDVFLRVCTKAAQESYWVRLETSAFRGLQAQEPTRTQPQGAEREYRRILINLILDADYQREPFDLAAVFIDATKQPLLDWLEELRRALLPSAPAAGPAAATPLATATGPTAPARDEAAAAPGGFAPTGSPAGPAQLSAPGRDTDTFGGVAPPDATGPEGPRATLGNAPAGGPLLRRRMPGRRVVIPAAAAVALTLVVALSGLLLESQFARRLTSGRTQPSPTPTWTLPPVPTATPTVLLTPAVPTQPPGQPQTSSFPDAYFSIQVPTDWGTPHDDGLCSSCGGVVVEWPGPLTDSGAYAVIELLTSQQWANASNDAVVDNADGWFLEQNGVTAQGRITTTVDGSPCVRGLFTANDGHFSAWLFGCHHGGHEYMMYFCASPSNWQDQSRGDITNMINSIQWQ